MSNSILQFSETQSIDPVWYVVHTQTHKELMVAGLLESCLPVHVFMPEVLQVWRGEMAMRPLFPHYLFVQADLSQVPASSINTTPGVTRLIGWNGSPTAVQNTVIAAIRQECERFNALGGLFSVKLSAGDRVRLLEGPLAGMEAVFLKPLSPGTRAEVLLRFLGQDRQAVVEMMHLEKVAWDETHQSTQVKTYAPRQRSSRGHGRPIAALIR